LDHAEPEAYDGVRDKSARDGTHPLWLVLHPLLAVGQISDFIVYRCPIYSSTCCRYLRYIVSSSFLTAIKSNFSNAQFLGFTAYRQMTQFAEIRAPINTGLMIDSHGCMTCDTPELPVTLYYTDLQEQSDERYCVELRLLYTN
jgi:hypothetical protein